MAHSNKLPLALLALALVVIVAGVLAPARAPASMPGQASAGTGEVTIELILFGSSLDDVRLEQDAQPLLVYRVPAGSALNITDVDATSGGLVLWRRSQQQLEQVGFVVDRGSVGLGQSSRSYATGIPFGPGDEVLVQAAAGDVEWATLRGVESPAASSDQP